MKGYALVVLTLALVTAGCEALRSVEPPVAPDPCVRTESPRPSVDSDNLLRYFEYVRKLPAAGRAKEHDTMRQLYARTPSDVNRVRYAMLLSVPGAAFNDDTRALELLEPLLKKPDATLHGFAFMVGAQIQEQRRAQALQQKLEALKSLEKSLIERSPNGATKRR